jgi:single-stranded-DNA-specific exonuclease
LLFFSRRAPGRASALAFELEACNTERRATEKRIVEEARGLVLEREPLPDFLFAWSREWHRGVVGIAASRIAREFHRPTVLLAADGEEATGSGRSIEGVDLHGFLKQWESRFERFGGHSQAIGLTVRTDELLDLRGEIEGEAHWPSELLVQRRHYELHLEPSAIDEQLFSELEKLHPHGQKNQRPLMRVGPLQLSEEPRIFGDGHLKARAHGGGSRSLAILGWGWEDRAHLLAGEFEILGRLGWDSFDRCMVLELSSARACPQARALQR